MAEREILDLYGPWFQHPDGRFVDWSDMPKRPTLTEDEAGAVGEAYAGHYGDHATRRVIARLRAATEPDRKLDEAVARALGFRIAATTGGPHIMRDGSVASWGLPAYTATADSRAEAIRRLSQQK